MKVKLFAAFLKRLGYQCCVGHLNITTIAFVLSLYVFAVTFPSKLKGGKIQQISVFHLIEKASIARVLGSGFQEIYL